MRYAIYFTPDADDPLCLASARWLGRDAFGRAIEPAPVSDGFSADEFASLTREPRRYGFHGTLVAPFRLAEAETAETLKASLAKFALHHAPFVIPRLHVSRIGAFYALVPHEPVARLHELADALVRHFANLRAPLSSDEIARRNPDRLTANQCGHLEGWGYPYVFDEFRFHMTLTGPTGEQDCQRIERALHHWFDPLLEHPVEVRALTIFAEAEPGAPFEVLHSVPLTG